MEQPYEGTGAATFLKGIAVLVGALAAIGAITVWSTAGQARLSVDGSIETGVNPATIFAGFLVLGEGILLAVLTYAVGVTVDHLIAIRRQLDSGTTGLVPDGASMGAQVHEPVAGPTTYRVVLVSVGDTPKAVAQLLREQSNWHWSERELRRQGSGTVLGSSLSEARAGALKEALAAKGAVAEIEPDRR